jgi:fused signal recognition particle receptor
MAFKDRVSRSRTKFGERMNVLFRRGPKLDEDFWDDLEETLILSDLGARATMTVIDSLRDQATRRALPDAYAVLDLLADEISSLFAQTESDPFHMNPVCVLFVGINGAGKTTTVGKLANQATIGGRKVLIGSADTFRAAAIEQLDVWGQRSGVEVVKRERGSDPASVCYDVIERAEELGSDLILIDTSGRLHTSDELMRELQKVVNVTRKRANFDVKTVLVIDATTGQNGLAQAREFDKALDLDGVIMTKLDGTAKGGIAVAVSHELNLPILRVGVGEGIEDLQPFEAREYAEALFGEMRDYESDDSSLDEGDTEHISSVVSEAVSEIPDEETGFEPEEASCVFEEPQDAHIEPDESDDVVDAELTVPDGESGEIESEPDREDESEAVPEPEPESEAADEKESFRAKMRRWFS